MSKGNQIVISENPRGRFSEGYVNAALKPGTFVTIDVSEGLGDDGRLDWEAYNLAADGNRYLLAILIEDQLQGKDMTTAYASGDRCFLYFPLPGDELNVLFNNVAGTGDDVAFGDLLIIDDGTGKVNVTTGSPESEPLISLEALNDPTADALLHAICTGY